MEFEQLRKFMAKYQCDVETAAYYFELRPRAGLPLVRISRSRGASS